MKMFVTNQQSLPHVIHSFSELLTQRRMLGLGLHPHYSSSQAKSETEARLSPRSALARSRLSSPQRRALRSAEWQKLASHLHHQHSLLHRACQTGYTCHGPPDPPLWPGSKRFWRLCSLPFSSPLLGSNSIRPMPWPVGLTPLFSSCVLPRG